VESVRTRDDKGHDREGRKATIRSDKKETPKTGAAVESGEKERFTTKREEPRKEEGGGH